jgi:regulatory protein
MRKLCQIPTPEKLEKAAADYLGRMASTEASLRRVLTNRLRRAAIAHPAFAADQAGQKLLQDSIETIIARHKRSGMLNDDSYAETRAHSLRRSGRSRRAIQQTLAHKGVSAESIARALTETDGEDDKDAAELKAAQALARRRKIGPYRQTPADEAQKRKDFGILARAGYGMGIIKTVLGNEGLEVGD